MDMETEISKALRNDTIFNNINKKFITLNTDDIKQNNKYLHKVITTLITKMKVEDEYFKEIFNSFTFGGSYYKKTKIEKPEEFDVNMIIKLPIDYDLIHIDQACEPGFVKLYLPNAYILSSKNPLICRSFKKLLTSDMYINQNEFRNWIEGTIMKAINKLPVYNGGHLLEIEEMNECVEKEKYIIKIRKNGPAFTIQITIPNNQVISVDLVPVLSFNKDLPKQKDKLESFKNRTWFAVPKPFNNNFVFNKDQNICWRLSFYEQEKILLSKHGYIKPVIRQLKKLRNTKQWKCIASYYIETICLHELDMQTEKKFTSSTELLVNMMKKLYLACRDYMLPYYWDENNNLLRTKRREEVSNVANCLKRIIAEIEKTITCNPYVVMRHILNKSEFTILQNELQISIETHKSDNISEHVENKSSLSIWNEDPKFYSDLISQLSSTMKMLASMENEIQNMNKSITQLTERVINIEKKIDVLYK